MIFVIAEWQWSSWSDCDLLCNQGKRKRVQKCVSKTTGLEIQSSNCILPDRQTNLEETCSSLPDCPSKQFFIIYIYHYACL